jgi:hypothetical protein
MQPQIVAPAYFSEGHEIVHRTGVGSSGGSDYTERLLSGGQVGVYRLFENSQIQLYILIHRDAP